MNDYRSYFDRVKVSNTLHQKLLLGERAQKRRAPVAVRYGSMVACLALICLAGFGVWRWSTPHVGGDISVGDSLIPGEKDTYGPGETPPVLAGDEYVLSPAETLYTPTKVTPVNFEGGTELAASIAMPEGWFEEKLTRAQMVTLLGGEEENDAPWYLMWSGYNITGKAIYDGTGKLWRVELQGVERADDKNSFSMTLRPGALPEDCVVENEKATVVNGVSVGGSKGQYGWDDSGTLGEVRKLTFMAGDVGVAYRVYHRSGKQAEVLASRAAQCYAGRPDTETLFALSLDGLDPYEGEIPAWRSEKLTHDQARTEEGFGKYVPTWVPEGFAFESAWRELGQNRDWMSVYWSGYYTNISVTISRPFEEIEVMDVENRAYYDERLYTAPYADSVPDEVMFGGFQDPIFRFEDLTLDVLAARITLATGDAGDIDNYGGNFSVLYPDGLVARYSFKGVSPEEAVKLLDAPDAWPTPVPGEDVLLDIDSAQLKDFILTSKDPFDGQPHNMFSITGINYGDGVGYRVPPERVNARHSFLAREQMIDLLGGSEELGAPWTYGWQGYDVTGTVYYDDLGTVTMVILKGQDQKEDSDTFTLVLEPSVDSAVMLKGEYKITEIGERKIRGDHYQSEEGGCGYHVAFNVGDIGVYFGAAGYEEERVENLVTLFANFAQEFHLEQLVPEKMSEYPQAPQKMSNS